MKGEELKLKLKRAGVSITEVASLIGMSRQSLSQALSVKDVKTGLIEDLSKALNIPLGYFYGDSVNQKAIANGEKSVAAINSSISAPNDLFSYEELIALRAENKLLRELQGLNKKRG